MKREKKIEMKAGLPTEQHQYCVIWTVTNCQLAPFGYHD
jgi:hypothetical protein